MSKFNCITKELILSGIGGLEGNPKCRITKDRMDIMISTFCRGYNVNKQQLQSTSGFLYYDKYNKCLFLYFHCDVQIFVPNVFVGLKLLRSIFDIYNYKTENVLPYSEIAEIVGLTYEEFIASSDEDTLLDYPDIAEMVSSTYSELTLSMNGILFFTNREDSEIVVSVQKTFGMFNPYE